MFQLLVHELDADFNSRSSRITSKSSFRSNVLSFSANSTRALWTLNIRAFSQKTKQGFYITWTISSDSNCSPVFFLRMLSRSLMVILPSTTGQTDLRKRKTRLISIVSKPIKLQLWLWLWLLCLKLTLILPCHCLSTLPWLCLYLAWTSPWPWPCLDLTLTLPRHCLDLSLTLPKPAWPCPNLAFTLPQACIDLASTLPWACLDLAFKVMSK